MLKCITMNCFYTTEIMDLSQFLLVFICNYVILSNRMVVLNTILIKTTLLECLTTSLHLVLFIYWS